MVRLLLILALTIQPLLMRPGALSAQLRSLVVSVESASAGHAGTLRIDNYADAVSCSLTMLKVPPAPRPMRAMDCCAKAEPTKPAMPEPSCVADQPGCSMSLARCSCVCVSVPIDQRPTTPMPMHCAGSQTLSWLVARPRLSALLVVPTPTWLGQMRVAHADLTSLSHGLSQALRGIWQT